MFTYSIFRVPAERGIHLPISIFDETETGYSAFYPGMITKAIELGRITEPGSYMVIEINDGTVVEVHGPIEVARLGLAVV